MVTNLGMRLADPKLIFEAVSWQVRGLLATERKRRVGYMLRDLFQPAEVEARRGLGRDIATELLPELAMQSDPGHMRLPAAAIPDLSTVCAIGHKHAEAAAGELAGATPDAKTFSRYRFTTEDERVALLRVGLDRRLIAMISAYLGVLPVISEADFYCSFPISGPFKKSQLWHCDHDGEHVTKVFIYCEDVGADDGPFELVSSGHSRRARDELGYRYAGRRYRVADTIMDQRVAPSEQITVQGPAGTAFVTDTTLCFHRGSRIRANGHRRVAAIITYVAPSGSKLPLRLRTRSAPLIGFAEHFSSEIDRAVLGVPMSSSWI